MPSDSSLHGSNSLDVKAQNIKNNSQDSGIKKPFSHTEKINSERQKLSEYQK